MPDEGLVEPRGPPLAAEHADAVTASCQAGVDEGNATFEAAVPWGRFDAARLSEHRFAALDGTGRVLGRIAVAEVSERSAYAGVVEHPVYVPPAARGRGVASSGASAPASASDGITGSGATPSSSSAAAPASTEWRGPLTVRGASGVSPGCLRDAPGCLRGASEMPLGAVTARSAG
ncbi:hypothetical protein SAMN05428939_6857 [Streptomyces sp. TLI_105]|nr:hypothetical protein SAMN05428939_6857 [Streptomyces sp. TLI_105]